MGNVISFKKAWLEKKAEKKAEAKLEELEPAYHAQILGMGKLDLLREMVRFQDERNRRGFLDTQMMVQGQILFRALEKVAETQELRSLARSYNRHLRFELEARSN